jgi:hypothetical protein
MSDIVEQLRAIERRLRAENADLRASNATLDEASINLRAEIERLRADLKIAGVQPLADSIRLQEMYREGAARLRAKIAELMEHDF